MNKKTKALYRKRFNRDQNRLMQISRGVAFNALNTQVKPTLDMIQSIDNLQLVLRNLNQIKSSVVKNMITDIWVRTGLHFAEQTLDQINGTKSLHKKEITEEMVHMMRSNIVRYVEREFGSKIVGITNASKGLVKRQIESGIKSGASIAEIKRNITNNINSINASRAGTIARTEVLSASNKGSLIGAQASGIQLMKEWISSPGAREGEFDHGIADGETVNVNGMFHRTGEALEFPGDPSGSPGNIINCRCTHVFIPIR